MDQFEKKIIREYLKYGSVDEVLARNTFPISRAGCHRLLDKWGVVKSAGPNNRISEAVDFMERLTGEKLPLERVYKKLPPSFQTSAMTLHRILSHVKQGVVRREATALIITPAGNERSVLMGKDVASPKLKYGQMYGAYSLPMTFSKKNENSEIAVRRVLQQEVFSKQMVEGNFPGELITKKMDSFLFFEVADIRLRVYLLVLPGGIGLGDFESGRLVDYEFFDLDEISERRLFRTGVVEIVGYYGRYLKGGLKNQKLAVSEVNRELALSYL